VAGVRFGREEVGGHGGWPANSWRPMGVVGPLGLTDAGLGKRAICWPVTARGAKWNRADCAEKEGRRTSDGPTHRRRSRRRPCAPALRFDPPPARRRFQRIQGEDECTASFVVSLDSLGDPRRPLASVMIAAGS
jgi:hypothetical protein